jgi:DNA polymerase III epsilon subunit-like protein
MVLLKVIDFETTGLDDYRTNYRTDLPISIGALVADLKDDKTIECKGSLYSLIRIPNPSWAQDSKRIHGIPVEDIATAPEPSKVCEQYLKFKHKYGFEEAAAWNYTFDKKHFGRLFGLANAKAPEMNWRELQPAPYVSLDSCIPRINCDYVRSRSSHNALNDCALELCFYAENNGYSLDVSSVKKVLESWKS